MLSDYASQYCVNRVSEREKKTTVHSLRLADLESPSGTETRGVFSLSASDLHEVYTSRAKQSQEIREGTNSPWFRSLIQPLVLSEWLMVWMGGRAAASQPQHQHPQADHVGTHVPENADAFHRPGWALRWRPGAACGPCGMRQTWTPCLGC